MQWSARYNGSGNGADVARGIALDSDKNIYVTGQGLTDVTNFGSDIVTVKYNSSGVQQWVRSLSGTRHLSGDRGNAITCDNLGNIYVTGACNDSIDEVMFCTIKYSPDGDLIWFAKTDLFVNRPDEAFYIKVDNNESVFVSGVITGITNYDDIATVKYNSQGVKEWENVYDGSGHFMDRPWDMEIDNLGNVYVTGSSTESGSGYDFTTIKYGTNGETIWLRRYNNGLNDIPSDIAIDKAGNIYVTGRSSGNGTDFDCATLKYDSSGNQKWVIRYNDGGQVVDESRAVGLDNLENVFITGYSNRSFLTIKYSQTLTGINQEPFENPVKFNLSQNYPNPFNPMTIIKYKCSMYNDVSLKVFDVLGNEVTELVNEKQNAGSYRVDFDGSNLPSGIYFYSLYIDGNLLDSKRMILLK